MWLAEPYKCYLMTFREGNVIKRLECAELNLVIWYSSPWYRARKAGKEKLPLSEDREGLSLFTYLKGKDKDWPFEENLENCKCLLQRFFSPSSWKGRVVNECYLYLLEGLDKKGLDLKSMLSWRKEAHSGGKLFDLYKGWIVILLFQKNKDAIITWCDTGKYPVMFVLQKTPTVFVTATGRTPVTSPQQVFRYNSGK